MITFRPSYEPLKFFRIEIGIKKTDMQRSTSASENK